MQNTDTTGESVQPKKGKKTSTCMWKSSTAGKRAGPSMLVVYMQGPFKQASPSSGA